MSENATASQESAPCPDGHIIDTNGRPVKQGMGGFLYWMCNSIETFERLAYFTLRPVAAVYICQPDNPGGLHLTQSAKGTIFMWWFILQSLLPMVTGGYADRYGYRRILFLSVFMNMAGYICMGCCHSYWGFFGGVILLATGTAFFKPGLQGTIAHLLTKQNSSLGWGTFYWIVNVGAYIGHIASAIILVSKGQDEWRLMFFFCAGLTAMNIPLLIFAFRDIPSGASKTESVVDTFARTIRNVFEPRLITWLLIMSCFWLMMYQLWDLQPNYIEDWVDSSMVATYLPESLVEMGPSGIPRVEQQMLLSLNSLMIVALIIFVSIGVRKMRTLSAMMIGMVGVTIGLLVAGLTNNGWVLLLGIVFFSLGEMLTGPKKNEYLGLIAPPGKKGLYLGYVNIPVGLGGAVGSKLAGYVYGSYGEKAILSLKYLVEHTPFGVGKNWDGSASTLEAVTGITRNDAFAVMQEKLGVDGVEATRILWETYSPQYYTWIPFAAIGLFATIALFLFGLRAKRWSDMNV